jgi:hypothetical protein
MMTSRDERLARDALILRLHLAGISYRDIGRRAKLSVSVVHRVVRRELAKASQRRDDLEDEATTAHLERLDSLLAAQMPRALGGDVKAAEFCRRLLDSVARVQGLNSSVAERLGPMLPADDVDDFGDDEVVDHDALARHRLRYEDSPRGREARADADARVKREYDEAARRGITWYDMTAEDKRQLHAVRDVG